MADQTPESGMVEFARLPDEIAVIRIVGRCSFQNSAYLEKAAEICERIDRGADFWTAVYEPYSRNVISREVVRLVIERSRAVAGKSMPQIARYLKAVDGGAEGDEEEKKRFFRFKNFLYKTVKI